MWLLLPLILERRSIIGAHRKHLETVCDAVCVEAQRLVEGRSVLPSQRRGTARRSNGTRNLVLCKVRTGRRERAMHAERVCGEQTANIPVMLVTLEVSKISGWLNADAFCQGSGLGLGLHGLGLEL